MQNQKFISYVRVSTKSQKYSLESQINEINSFIKSINGELIDSFEEICSGKNNNRPALNAAMSACINSSATLICFSLDRLSRDESFIGSLLENHRVIFVKDVKNLKEESRFAQRERELISERTKAGLAVAKARGARLGNPMPAESLKRASQAIQIRKAGFATRISKTIKEIQGAGVRSLTQIADCLNKRGEKTRRNGAWTATAVKRVLETQATNSFDLKS